jgi:hypothetical protein
MFGWQEAVEAEWLNGQAWADLPRVPRQRTGRAATVLAGSFIKYKIELGRTGKGLPPIVMIIEYFCGNKSPYKRKRRRQQDTRKVTTVSNQVMIRKLAFF